MILSFEQNDESFCWMKKQLQIFNRFCQQTAFMHKLCKYSRFSIYIFVTAEVIRHFSISNYCFYKVLKVRLMYACICQRNHKRRPQSLFTISEINNVLHLLFLNQSNRVQPSWYILQKYYVLLILVASNQLYEYHFKHPKWNKNYPFTKACKQ